MNNQNLRAYMEIIADSETGCVDPLFKEACLAILPLAKDALSNEEFEHIVVYAVEKMKEKIPPKSSLKYAVRKTIVTSM